MLYKYITKIATNEKFLILTLPIFEYYVYILNTKVSNKY